MPFRFRKQLAPKFVAMQVGRLYAGLDHKANPKYRLCISLTSNSCGHLFYSVQLVIEECFLGIDIEANILNLCDYRYVCKRVSSFLSLKVFLIVVELLSPSDIHCIIKSNCFL